MSTQDKPSPLNGRFYLLSLLIMAVILLSGCTGASYPNPIPCGDTDLLIRAIEIANSDSDPDTIELAAGCAYELTEVYDHGGIVGSTGLPQITSEITIIGHGASIARNSAESTPKFRLILVGDGGYLLLQNLTLQNGYAYDPLEPTDMHRNAGGAIRNEHQLNLEYVTIQDNRAYGVTGGIWNEGSLGMIFSSISGSRHDLHSSLTPGLYGVALHNHPIGASVVIVQSTIYENGCLVEAGGYAPETISNNQGASMIFENSTISNNCGTAITNEGDLDLTFSTIASSRGGIQSYSYGTPTLDSIGTLILSGTLDCDFDPAMLTTNQNNMDTDGTCGFPDTVPPLDLGLLPLANNGGATLTRALDPSSPAIDAVVGGCPVYEDQRDVARPQNASCDIGAFEHDGIIPPFTAEIDIPPTETPVVPPVDDPGDDSGGDPEDPPPPLPDRCGLFDSEKARLIMHEIPYGDTTLELYVEYPHLLPGLEEEIPSDTRSWQYSATLGKAVADECTYRDYSGRIYCTFELTKAYFGYAYPLKVMVNFCDIPIFSHDGVSVFEPDPPATKTPTPISCNVNLNEPDCKASGGTYDQVKQLCNCP